jgi:transposase InsO family protein
MDDFSRYIIPWRLCTTMSARDVAETLRDALEATGLDRVSVRHRPRLLSDNGPCYVSSELKDWLTDNTIPHTRGNPDHPQPQGTIERWHRTLKDRILLEHHYLPGDLERQLQDCITHDHTRRYHESLNNLPPECVVTGPGIAVLKTRNAIKLKPLALRKTLPAERQAA